MSDFGKAIVLKRQSDARMRLRSVWRARHAGEWMGARARSLIREEVNYLRFCHAALKCLNGCQS